MPASRSGLALLALLLCAASSAVEFVRSRGSLRGPLVFVFLGILVFALGAFLR